LYCRGNYHPGSRLEICPTCHELSDYALTRLEKCPFKSEKPTCANCTVHCYRPEMRDRIRMVMRYSGPRMLLRHPVLAVLHLLDRRKPAPGRIKKARG
jgi:hypothetical protein